jgi:hypothetical protein
MRRFPAWCVHDDDDMARSTVRQNTAALSGLAQLTLKPHVR